MRKTLSLLCFIMLLGVALPAQAQLREDAHRLRAPAKLYDQGGSSFALNKFFSPEHFKMSHTFEMSSTSFGGHGMSMGMYTNTMQWQFSQKLAARMDVAVAYSPNANQFGNAHKLTAGNSPRVFLRNAEVAYKPSENVRLQLSVRQSPYGLYASPYGYGGYGRYGAYNGFHNAFGPASDNLFWNDRAH